MKGVIQPDHVPVNKYKFLVIGLLGPPYLTPVTVSGSTEESEWVELPDLTVAPLGRTRPVEFSIGIPMHHKAEQTALELWMIESREPQIPTYKKPCVLTHQSISGDNMSYVYLDAFPLSRVLPNLSMADDGNMAVVTWNFKASLVLPLFIAESIVGAVGNLL